MFRFLTLAAGFIFCFNIVQASRGDIVSFTLVETKTASQLAADATASTGLPSTIFGFEYDISVYKVAYETVDYDGISPTIATGLVAFPDNYPCPPPMCTYGHGLALKHAEAPSNAGNTYGFICKGIAANGYIGIAPDYIHMGPDASPGFQAFMHANTEAAATIDLIRATRTYCQNNGITYNNQLFISGYSQGGHFSMATCKAMQENYADEFTITAAMPGGGTFDLSGIAADSLASPTRTTGEPHAFCLISRAYYEIYRNELFDIVGYDIPFNDIFKSPYDSLLHLILDAANPFANTGLLDSIPNRMLEEPFHTEFLTNPDFWMRTFLGYNNLYNWAPQFPMRLFHSDADVENPYPNALFTLEQMQLNGAPDVELQTVSGFSHGQAGLYHVLALRQWFATMRQDCGTAVAVAGQLAKATAYPNPFTKTCTIDLSAVNTPVTGWKLYNLNGQLLQTGQPDANNRQITITRTAGMAKGVYVVWLLGKNGTQTGIPLLVGNE